MVVIESATFPCTDISPDTSCKTLLGRGYAEDNIMLKQDLHTVEWFRYHKRRLRVRSGACTLRCPVR